VSLNYHHGFYFNRRSMLSIGFVPGEFMFVAWPRSGRRGFTRYWHDWDWCAPRNPLVLLGEVQQPSLGEGICHAGNGANARRVLFQIIFVHKDLTRIIRVFYTENAKR
jgi:hypothetical protein